MPSNLNTGTLIDRLIPGIDKVRGAVHGLVGDRQWDVRVVLRKWPSGRRNDASAGPPVVTELELLPTPRVRAYDKLGFEMRSAGREEEGTIVLSEISLSYSEDQLMPKGLDKDTEFFYRLEDSKGQLANDRQFVPMGPPDPDREKDIGWTIKLKRRHVNE